jgi:hypothetical protein
LHLNRNRPRTLRPRPRETLKTFKNSLSLVGNQNYTHLALFIVYRVFEFDSEDDDDLQWFRRIERNLGLTEENHIGEFESEEEDNDGYNWFSFM